MGVVNKMKFDEKYYIEKASEEELESLDWSYLCDFNLTEHFIKKFKNKIYWKGLLLNQIYSEQLLDSCSDFIDFDLLAYKQIVSESFIEKYADRFSWCGWLTISAKQNLSESFIEKYLDRVCWTNIASNQKLSEEFIKKYKAVLPSEYIFRFQKISESFIEQNPEYANWFAISKFQKLSESFIEKHFSKLDKYNISKYQKLSDKFIQKYKDELFMNVIDDSWHYKSADFKKQKIIETNLYNEYYDDFFIGYKGIRLNRYSKYNFQYKYEKGGVYESWSDVSNEENSFGLSVWTESLAREYCDELVVRVKVKYEDVARIIHEGGKIRCFKIEILD